MTNKYTIDDILNAVVDEKPVDLQAAVNALMVDKAHDHIAGLKSVIMQDMLNGNTDSEDEAEEEIEDDDDSEEDEIEELDAEELFTDNEEEQE